jgi:hypothetical protein
VIKKKYFCDTSDSQLFKKSCDKMLSPVNKKIKLGSSPVKSRLRPGCGINSQCQELIIRFYNYLEIEMIKKFPLTAKEDIISELIKATQLSRSKLFGIVNGGISGIKSPKKQKRQKGSEGLNGLYPIKIGRWV